MSYTRTSRYDTAGTQSARDVQGWLEANVARGAAAANQAARGIPAGYGQMLVELVKQHNLDTGKLLNHDLIAAQGPAHEAAYLQSLIYRTKLNPAGYGAENQDPMGTAWTFDTDEDGLRQFIGHISGYVYGDNDWSMRVYKGKKSRYELLVKPNGWGGSVKELWQLEQKYAYTNPNVYAQLPPSARYGAMIAAHAENLVQFGQGLNSGGLPGRDNRFAWTPEACKEYGYPGKGNKGRGREQLELFVLHITIGSDSQGHLQGCNGNSSHYLTTLDALPRSQFIEEPDAAWSAGSQEYNERGIQMEKEKRYLSDPWSDAHYHNLATTCYPILKRNSLPLIYLGRDNARGKRGIIGHSDVPDPNDPGLYGGDGNHQDPGPNFNWKYWLELLHKLDGEAAPPVDDGLYLIGPDGKAWPYAFRRGFKGVVYQLGLARYPQDVNAAILSITGYPVEEEWRGVDGRVFQRCERCILVYEANVGMPWDVTMAAVHTVLPEPVPV